MSIFSSSLFEVTLHVEIKKEEEENQYVTCNKPDKYDREITFDKEQLGNVNSNSNKLNDLDIGEVLFVNEIFLEFRTESCHKIVEIHQDVHKRIEKLEESAMPSTSESNARP